MNSTPSLTSSTSISKVGGLGGAETTLIPSRGVLTLEQVKPVIQEGTQGASQDVSALPKHIIETPWTLLDLVARESLLNTYSWSTASTWGSPLYFVPVMDPTMQSIGTMVHPFSCMNYWRGSPVITIKLNGTQFHCGRLIAYFVPLCYTSSITTNQQRSRSFATTMQHVFLDASTSSAGVLKIPFVHYYSYLPTKAISGNDFALYTTNSSCLPGGQLPSLGTIIIQAWQPLQATTGAPTTLNFTITVRIEDAEFYVPANQSTATLAESTIVPQAGVVAMPPTQEEAASDVPIMGAQTSTRIPTESEQVCRSYRDVLKRYHQMYTGPLLVDTSLTNIYDPTLIAGPLVFANAVNLNTLFTGATNTDRCITMFAKVMALYGLLKGSIKLKFVWNPGNIPVGTSPNPFESDLRPFIAYLPGVDYNYIANSHYHNASHVVAPVVAPVIHALTAALSNNAVDAETSLGYTGPWPIGITYPGGNPAAFYAIGTGNIPFTFMDRNTPYASIEVPFCSALESYPTFGDFESIDGVPGTIVYGYQAPGFNTTPELIPNLGNFSIFASFGDATRAGCITQLPGIMPSGYTFNNSGTPTFYPSGSDNWSQSPNRPSFPPSLASSKQKKTKLAKLEEEYIIPQSGVISFFSDLAKKILPSQKTLDTIGKLSGLAAVLDKPSNPISGEHFLRQPMPNFANAEDIEPVTSLSLYPSHITECDVSTFNTTQDEMSLDYLTQKMTAFDTFNWPTSSAAGTVLYYCPLAPMPEFLGTSVLTAGYIGQQITPSLLSYVSADFNYWTGGLKYRFQIAPTRFHQGRIFISVVLDDYASPGAITSLTLIQATSQYGAYVDLADGVTDFTFEVPYVSRFARRHVPNGPNTGVLQANSQSPGNGANSIIGYLSVWVVNDLVAQPGAPTSINVVCFQGGASDFRLSHLGWNNISLLTGN